MKNKEYLRNQVCCFTGHRHIPEEYYETLKQQLRQEIENLILKGVCYFGAGGALGFDTLAALTVLELKQQYPLIKLILVLPCPKQAKYSITYFIIFHFVSFYNMIDFSYFL